MRKEALDAEDKEREIEKTLAKIKNKLIVLSGKGGVGKSTVAVNLAQALSQRGQKVGLLDVDLHGPNLAKMLGVEGMKSINIQCKIMPIKINDNLKLISMALFLDSPNSPVIWRGPLKMKIIQQFLSDVDWGDLDWLICDSPPGTGDEPLSVAQLIPATTALIVTTPQAVSLLDSRKAIAFAKKLKLRIIGVVENMSGFICPQCGKRTDLFKAGGGKRVAEECGIPFLGNIPIDSQIVDSGDSGKSYLADNRESKAAKEFNSIVDKIIKNVV
jgi:Mrp family chromosome partitioning ATPase